MHSVDTNIVVRYITRDHPEQFNAACAVLENRTAWLSVTVVLELEWVLRSAYRFGPADISRAIRRLLGMANIVVDAPADVASALDWFDQGMDFADALHLARARHCEGMATFDRDFIRSAARIGAGNVSEP
jgi:predicted nucleic-acid-binding protein